MHWGGGGGVDGEGGRGRCVSGGGGGGADGEGGRGRCGGGGGGSSSSSSSSSNSSSCSTFLLKAAFAQVLLNLHCLVFWPLKRALNLLHVLLPSSLKLMKEYFCKYSRRRPTDKLKQAVIK